MDMLAMQLVRTYGEEILSSPEFLKAMQQKHHHVTTVGEHSIGVAYTSVKICRFLASMHIKTDTKAMVRGALCHDLGIVGRYEKFRNNLVCWQRHPKESVMVAEKLLGNLTSREKDIIGRHMWPTTPLPPHCREGYVITIADKYCSVREVVARIKGKNRKKKRGLS